MITLNTVFNCDCLEIMNQCDDKSIDLIVTDPPYGINVMSKNATRGSSGKSKTTLKNNSRKRDILAKDYGRIEWDNTPPSKEYFDEIFRISKNQIIFGGNFFDLPPSPCWIVWDKENTGCFADAELAWTSFPTAVRLFKFRWNGCIQGDMARREKRVHPNQKPVRLFEWILSKYAKEGDIIFDPFMGSGSCIVAAIKRGHSFIGCEQEKDYFVSAKKRIDHHKAQIKLVVS